MVKGFKYFGFIFVLIFAVNTFIYGSNKHSNNSFGDDVKKNSQQSEEYKLFQNYPNPFNPITKISYRIDTEGLVSVKVYNLVGQVLRELVNENQQPGKYEVYFDASELPTGVYLYKLQINGFTSVKRMTVLK